MARFAPWRNAGRPCRRRGRPGLRGAGAPLHPGYGLRADCRGLPLRQPQADQAIERSRQKMASDPAMQNFLQAWRAMFPGAADAEVYEDVGE